MSLLGNHEMMNLMGDLRYVTLENYASFGDSNSEQRQKSAYQQYMKWRDSHAAALAELPQPMEITEAEWMARHPLGFVEHAEAFGPERDLWQVGARTRCSGRNWRHRFSCMGESIPVWLT